MVDVVVLVVVGSVVVVVHSVVVVVDSVEISSEFDVAYDEGLFVEYSFYFGNSFGVFITADWYITRLRSFIDQIK